MNRQLQLSVCLAMAVVIVGTIPVQATKLTFDIYDAANTTQITAESSLVSGTHAAYGDNASSPANSVGGFTYRYGSTYGFTTNITVAYSTGGHAGSGVTYYHEPGPSAPYDIPGAAYLTDSSVANANGRDFYFTFTPSAGFGTRINSFELFDYGPAAGTHSGTWRIRQDSTTGPIIDSAAFAVPYGTPYTAPVVVTTAGLDYMGTLVLEIDHTTGSGGRFFLDDLAFNQEVPEPTAAALLAAAGVLLWRRRESR